VDTQASPPASVPDAQGGELPPFVPTAACDLRYPPSALSMSPDGATVAVVHYPGSIELLRVVDGAHIRCLGPGRPRARVDAQPRVTFLPDGSQVVADAYLGSRSDAKVVEFWRVADGALVHEIHGEYEAILSPDGQLVLSLRPMVARVSDGKVLWSAQLPGSANLPEGKFSPDGRTVALGDWYGRIWIYTADTGVLVSKIQGWDFSDGNDITSLE
jgi:WD40 repeat protein